MNVKKIIEPYFGVGKAIGGLVRHIESLLNASGNYIADREVEPREVRFANGRVVRVIGDGYLEVDNR